MASTDGRTWRLANLTMPAAVGLLSGASLVAAVAAGWFEYARSGAVGLAAVAAAALTCWTASLASLVLSAAWRNTPQAVTGILGGVLVRMSLPLGVVVLASVNGGPLARAGLIGWIACFFLITLLIETLLLVWVVNSPRPTARPTAASRASNVV